MERKCANVNIPVDDRPTSPDQVSNGNCKESSDISAF